MTRFWRDGFYRTSVHGNIHWVEGHAVQRDDWERAASERREGYVLTNVRAHVGTTSRQVVPNAECPVCGEPVFFYQNEHGSRVFFDELGPPWPKHPCTVNEVHAGSVTTTCIAPRRENVRPIDEIEFIKSWGGHESELMFANKYGTGRWDIAVFLLTYIGDEFSAIVLKTLRGYRYYLLPASATVTMQPGQLVTYYRNWISYLDISRLEQVDVEYQRIQGKRILHRILGVTE